MYRIIDKRASGKTSRLLLLAKETGATIVCSNPRAMVEKAKAYGITGIECISYNEYKRNAFGTKKKYLIDELEMFVKYLSLYGEVVGYTITNED